MASYARKLFEEAKGFDDEKAKIKTLKMAQNACYTECDYELETEIVKYAKACGIDLDSVSGYDY